MTEAQFKAIKSLTAENPFISDTTVPSIVFILTIYVLLIRFCQKILIVFIVFEALELFDNIKFPRLDGLRALLIKSLRRFAIMEGVKRPQTYCYYSIKYIL